MIWWNPTISFTWDCDNGTFHWDFESAEEKGYFLLWVLPSGSHANGHKMCLQVDWWSRVADVINRQKEKKEQMHRQKHGKKGQHDRRDCKKRMQWTTADAKLNWHRQRPSGPSTDWMGLKGVGGGDGKRARATEADRREILWAPDQTSARSWGDEGGRGSGAGGGPWPRPQPEEQTPAGARLTALRNKRQSRKRQWSRRRTRGVIGAVQQKGTEIAEMCLCVRAECLNREINNQEQNSLSISTFIGSKQVLNFQLRLM